MNVSLKCQYALRALFDLARRREDGPVRLADIAAAQAIPPRFLENIMNQMRQGGFVDSLRGKGGGFVLRRRPEEISVAEVVRFIEGPIKLVDCGGEHPARPCPLRGGCVFQALWDEARTAIEAVYERKSLANLVEESDRLETAKAAAFVI